ncbi:MAG: PAS domain S-box protein [Spirochaetia bacterium]
MKNRILIVEDEVIVAENIREKCVSFGYEVAGIESRGKDAVERAVREQPDLVLMDIKLKGDMDGIEAAERIKNRVDIPVLYLTSYSDDSTISRARITGPFGYVLKPFRDKELYSNIEMALYKHAIEKKLKESEDRYRRLSELMSDYAYLVEIDPEGESTLLWITEAFTRMTGYTVTIPSPGKNLRSFIHPEDIPVHSRFMERLRKRGDDTAEYRIVTETGRHIWIRNHAKLTEGPAEETHIILGAVKDITELKRIEEKLQANEYRYELLIKTLEDGLLVADEEDAAIFVNDAFSKHTGLSADVLIGKRVDEILDRLFGGDSSQKRFRKGDNHSFELEYQEGPLPRNLIITSVPINNGKDGIYKGRLITVRDVTDLRDEKVSLTRKAECYRKIFEVMPLPALIIDRDGKIDDVSDEFLRMTGYRRDQLVEKKMLQLANWGSLEDINALIEAAKGNDENIGPREVQLRASNGSVMKFRMGTHRLAELGIWEVLIVLNPISR